MRTLTKSKPKEPSNSLSRRKLSIWVGLSSSFSQLAKVAASVVGHSVRLMSPRQRKRGPSPTPRCTSEYPCLWASSTIALRLGPGSTQVMAPSRTSNGWSAKGGAGEGAPGEGAAGNGDAGEGELGDGDAGNGELGNGEEEVIAGALQGCRLGAAFVTPSFARRRSDVSPWP